ncbi:MAG TPA: phospho-sugar mutase [Polyangiaceae bacterium]|jgi:phosphomannomutase|nr:phospho-sugar mutase [Polyangiaceae bacterium]
MSRDDDALLAEARAWVEEDPDPETRAELSALIDAWRLDELRERFGAPLEFGTAGLRGVVGAGPSRMNQSVVERTTRAVAAHLLASHADATTLLVVVGFDARTTSRRFADAAIRVLTLAGIRVRHFVEPCPTPLVAFAARELGATAAIVVTASHNPAEYNGYKLYGSNAVQIVPPVDADIERLIRERDAPPTATAPATAEPFDGDIVERYLARLDEERPGGDRERTLAIVYTPLHGVGGVLATSALARAGFTDVAVVPEQAAPDGTFPTARSPNPEEPGTLALAVKLASSRGAKLVLANDPDADRLAVSVPAETSGYRALTGNQIGVLLADFVLSRTTWQPRPLVVTTIVSSPMLAVLAREHDARHEVTLTGFKWIWTAALALEELEGVRFTFGYEEAIGFSVGRGVRDKDGIAAAVWFAELAADCAGRGETVLDRLAALHRRHGLWASAQHAITRRGPGGTSELISSLDVAVKMPPTTLASRKVCNVVDYRDGAENRPPWLPASPLVLVDLGTEGRVLLRPSGTEPKLKIYADLRRDVTTADDASWKSESALESDARAAARELAVHVGLEA